MPAKNSRNAGGVRRAKKKIAPTTYGTNKGIMASSGGKKKGATRRGPVDGTLNREPRTKMKTLRKYVRQFDIDEAYRRSEVGGILRITIVAIRKRKNVVWAIDDIRFSECERKEKQWKG